MRQNVATGFSTPEFFLLQSVWHLFLQLTCQTAQEEEEEGERKKEKKEEDAEKKRKKVEEKNQEAQLFSPWPRRCQKNRKIIPTLFDAKDYLAMKSKSWLEVVRACFLEPGHTQAFGYQTWAFMPSFFY